MRAETLTQHIATALEQNISSTIARIDLGLAGVVEQLEGQLAIGGIKQSVMDDYLLRQERRLPGVEALRVARADGLVILGKGVDANNPVNWSDRDFFAYLREHSDDGLKISKPLKGRVSGRHVIGFVRRYNNPDGSFAGIVSAPVELEHFKELLSAFDLGTHGVLVLRDLDLGLITRMPPLPEPLNVVGNRGVSKDFQQSVASGVKRATFYTNAGADGYARISTFHQIPDASMMVVASVAKDDYMAGWSAEAFRTFAMGATFLLSSLVLGGALFRLIRQAEVGDRRIRDSEAFVMSVIDSLRARIAVIDTKGVIITVNQAWRRFAAANGAASPDGVGIGASYFEVCDALPASPNSTGDSALSKGVREVLTGSRPNLSLEYACPSPTAPQWFVLNVLPLQGSIKGAVVVHHDITERKLGEQALERVREGELRFKSDFLSHVSHELRSPLTAIKQFTSILVRGTSGQLNTEQLQYASIVLKNVGQLQSMINDLLEVTRLESGKLRVELVKVSIAAVAADALNTLDMTARAKGVVMSCDLPGDLPAAYADPVRLLQILIILLDNAVKFTPAGGAVTMTGSLPVDEPQVLLIEVRDTGCGINPDGAARLFERLYQEVGVNDDSRKGLGLGLYICKELVRRQGGRIWLTSKPGAGSTFSFTLPQFQAAVSSETIPAPVVGIESLATVTASADGAR